MWEQIRAIAWAQFRSTRNHFPRTDVGAILLWVVALLWYGLFAGLAVLFALILPNAPMKGLQTWLPTALLAVCAFWQLVPLFTLSGGWSLQLHKLLPYPIKDSTLFSIEALLRISTAPEMILVLLGGVIGLLRRPDLGLSGFALLLFIPINLFLSLALREFVLQGFARNRFREIFTVVIVSIGILPQILTRTPLGRKALPYISGVANGIGTPWREIAVISLGARYWIVDLLLVAVWTYLCYRLARFQFEKSLRRDEAFRVTSSATELAPNPIRKNSRLGGLADLPNRLFRDPLAALLQKEYRSLLRMPRFRIMFGMACVFSVLVFIPMMLDTRHGPGTFMRNNFLVVTTLYGLLILSDSLLLNFFGFDRKATQVYFVSPVPFRTVVVAKNLAAATFVGLQSLAVTVVALVLRIALGPMNVLNAVAAAAVVGIFFLSAGNFMSVTMARPLDPAQTFRNRAAGKLQLYMLLSAAGMCLLVGLGMLARWALDADWAMFAVLAVEFIIGFIVYRVATQTAIEKGMEHREQLIDALSRGPASAGLGLS
ncbi:MAG TPA: hypothetical protein VH302_11895 [Bryobacteraceae bacterium]|jgi:ABC-2 type transport system permease protein|nr:hypothetical protein [Bryobacteraceae bacterium]